jgi:hypothetical protein
VLLTCCRCDIGFVGSELWFHYIYGISGMDRGYGSRWIEDRSRTKGDSRF